MAFTTPTRPSRLAAKEVPPTPEKPRRSPRLAEKEAAAELAAKWTSRMSEVDYELISKRNEIIGFIRDNLQRMVANIEATSCRIERARFCTEFLNILLNKLDSDKEFEHHFRFVTRIHENLINKCTYYLSEMATKPTSDTYVNMDLMEASVRMLAVVSSIHHASLYNDE
jgi:hypothetical protein